MSLAGKVHKDKDVSDTPGPGAYERPPGIATKDSSAKQAPSFSMSGRTGKSKTEDGPGPGAYAATETMGKTGPKISLSGRVRNVHEGVVTSPGPGAYTSDSAFSKTKKGGPSYSMSGRNREAATTGDSPGPGAYSSPRSLGSGIADRKGAPSFSMGAKPRENKAVADSPGPGAYATATKFGPGAAPSYSLSPRTSSFGEGAKTPGPGSYSSDTAFSKTKGNGPAFSMAGRQDLYKIRADSVNFKPGGVGNTSTPKKK
jgi:hypothetical protein